MRSLVTLSLLFPLFVACDIQIGNGFDSGELPCDGSVVDLWRVQNHYGRIDARVDTVSGGTAFDPALELWTVDSWAGSVRGTDVGALMDAGDDEFPCTFPPPQFGCPAVDGNVSDDALLVVQSLGTCAGSVGGYEIQAEVDAMPAHLTFFGTVEYSEITYADAW